MARIKYFPLLIFLVCSVTCLYSQSTPPWTGIIAPSRAINWSNAGATISTSRTQCTSSACATVTGGNVTAATINEALASAPANTYVLIPAGTFSMNSGINFDSQSNITLRGSGSNSTFLVFTSASNPGNCNGHSICAQGSDVNYEGGPTNTATWSGTNGASGTYTKGATSIILSSKTNLTVGNPITLDQIDNQSDNGALYVGCEISDGSNACYSGAAPNGFERGGGSRSTIRGQQQMVTVTSISGTGPYTIGISPGIYASNWATGQSPQAWWATGPVLNDAVENISLDYTNNGGTGNDGITWFNCQGCWVKGIRSVRASTTGTAWGHVNWHLCNKCTVRDSYFYGYSGDAYGVAPEISSDGLVENNIFDYFTPTAVPNADCEGCVWDYNFQPGAFSGSANWLGASEEFHGIDLFILSEGNVGPGLYADSFHGTHDLNTYFRNRWDGKEQNNGAATTSNTVAVRMNPGTRYSNVIGNILGTIGYHNTYKSGIDDTNLYTSIYGCGAYPEVSMSGDSLSCPTSMFWGNWDSVNNAVRWNPSEVPSSLSAYANPVPSSQTLPASFIYSSKPSWWPSGKAWPVIGPDVTGGNVGQCSGGTNDSNEVLSASACSGGTMTPLTMVNSIPAMDCYFNVMKGGANGTGNPLAFDASTCYSGSSISPDPAAPQNLTGVVH
jgi:hypothetical protein